MTYPVVTTCKGFSNVSGGITLDGFLNLINYSAYEWELATIGCFLTARQHGYKKNRRITQRNNSILRRNNFISQRNNSISQRNNFILR
jgi:hypothetical protein